MIVIQIDPSYDTELRMDPKKNKFYLITHQRNYSTLHLRDLGTKILYFRECKLLLYCIAFTKNK